MVADGHAGDTGTDLGDDAGTLVPTDDGQQVVDPHQRPRLARRHHVAGDDVFVGVAQPGGLPFDEHLTGLRRVDLDLLDLPFLLGSVEYCCSALHRFSSDVELTVVSGHHGCRC